MEFVADSHGTHNEETNIYRAFARQRGSEPDSAAERVDNDDGERNKSCLKEAGWLRQSSSWGSWWVRWWRSHGSGPLRHPWAPTRSSWPAVCPAPLWWCNSGDRGSNATGADFQHFEFKLIIQPSFSLFANIGQTTISFATFSTKPPKVQYFHIIFKKKRLKLECYWSFACLKLDTNKMCVFKREPVRAEGGTRAPCDFIKGWLTDFLLSQTSCWMELPCF